MYVFGEIRQMPQCVNAYYFLWCESFSFFFFSLFFGGGGGGKNRDIFMAVICDMAKGRLADVRYFLESIHD